MTTNFFDSILIADKEKVHSAVIAWIFSKNNNLFSMEEKNIILKQICNISDDIYFEEIDAKAEVNSIDILINAKYNSDKTCIIVIENKIKSSVHGDQLNKYRTITEKNHSSALRKYVLLTFMDEKPKEQEWISFSYDKLANLLTGFFSEKDSSFDSYYVFKEYLDSLNNYINLKNNFINNYHIDEYKIIFTDGSKKKNLKSSDNYIANNQLETILQKCFLNDILNKLDLNDCYYYNITETHGNANLSIIFNSFKDKSEDNVDFDFAFQRSEERRVGKEC